MPVTDLDVRAFWKRMVAKRWRVCVAKVKFSVASLWRNRYLPRAASRISAPRAKVIERRPTTVYELEDLYETPI